MKTPLIRCYLRVNALITRNRISPVSARTASVMPFKYFLIRSRCAKNEGIN